LTAGGAERMVMLDVYMDASPAQGHDGGMDNKTADMLRSELLAILEETFALHHGAYTDKGTSFFETLAGIDHRLASRILPELKESIAGHVFHVRFYLVVLQEYMTGVRTGKTDWGESWALSSVDEEAWADLRKALESEYKKLVDFISKRADWENADHLGGALAILAHCAYHLGAIRQMKDIG
jgi:hypothetical protein